MMRHSQLLARVPAALIGLTACLLASSAPAQTGPALQQLGRSYQTNVRLLLQRYCKECHAGDRTEAEIDLESFASLADIRKQPKVWVKVREMLDSGQMPPKDAKQPADDERAKMQTWVRAFLTAEARSRAGDPGRVVLRRLSNAEYTYTLRDLTGVDSLDPAREFPVDGAAGEGFTNTGGALVMSPSLIGKYLDAAKGVAEHMVLLPDGVRFSPLATRRDHTDELLSRIRAFYQPFTGGPGGGAADWQGRTDPNEGGSLPIERYLRATLEEREALRSGAKSLQVVAEQRSLNAKYLGRLWRELTANPAQAKPSLMLDQLRASWRDAKPGDAKRLTGEIAQWQKLLWKFNKIGHIGRQGAPKSWLEATTPLAKQQEFRITLPPSPNGQDTELHLAASTAGDGAANDFVVWRNARLERAGKPAIRLSELRALHARLAKARREELSKTKAYLSAARSLMGTETVHAKQVAEAAKRWKLDQAKLNAWLVYLQIGDVGAVEVSGHFTQSMKKSGNYDFIQGWGTPATPSITANSSDQQVRIPGIARPHSIVVHPSPTLFAAVGWSSPIDGVVKIEARVEDAHPECGNGVEWFLQHRTKSKVGNVWKGDFAIAGKAAMSPKMVAVRKGELLSLIVGPRLKSHACDLTEVNLVITETTGDKRTWDLAKDVSDDILKANPHADRYGHRQTWHFYKGEMAKVQNLDARPIAVPAGSVLANWQAEQDAAKREQLADEVRALAIGDAPKDAASPDGLLHQQLRRLAADVDSDALRRDLKPDPRFGKHPLGHEGKPSELIVRAPTTVVFRVPAELAEGRQLVVTGELDPKHGREGSVQLVASVAKPELPPLSPTLPIVVRDDSQGRTRVEQSMDDFRDLFPLALCYARIVPIDEVVTLTLFYREDQHLQRLMLSDQQTAELNRLWDELSYVSREPFKLVVAFEQISEFATQDRPDLVVAFKPLGKVVRENANAFRERLMKTEPSHMAAVLDFADRAWRRPLSSEERRKLEQLYQRLRDSGMAHEEAVRTTLARILTSPTFLYRRERPAAGKEQEPVSDLELASRLSYFLWSSLPDERLRRVAAEGRLRDQEVLLEETRRMLNDERTERLAIHFACQWLHVRDFDKNDDKNEKLYPEFTELRGDMYGETVRFFADMFRNDGSIRGIFDADHTYLNEALARHYGIAGVQGSHWRRVEGVRRHGRGGLLGMATILASQSGASRTSPILRGNWVSETLLGERLPRPPANVPQLPETLPAGLTARQLIERHSSAPGCVKCHAKIDPYGFALEQYDAIGRLRPKKVDTKTTLEDGKAIEGVAGLRDYLIKNRHDDVMRQFCRKLLGYALGREVQLSDEVLLNEMLPRLKANNYGFSTAVTAIVTSRQFREIRGKQMALD